MMWLGAKDYTTLVRLATAGTTDATQFRVRLSEIHDEIARLRHEVELEKARANAAVDQLLVSKGQAPITPTEMPDPSQLFEEDPDEVTRQARRIAEGGVVSVLDEAR
jgi:hypothetical protein